MTRRARWYGVWVAITIAIPLSYGFAYGTFTVRVVCVLLAVVHVCCIPLWLRAQKRFLCSTAWARSQQIDPDQLKLFSLLQNYKT